ncbi:MAG: Tetratricopeptide repeat protein [Myxococcaceae bacterium]|nr:Tetratricopeptide repeat protein [Myxococcaceae bacterium]
MPTACLWLATVSLAISAVPDPARLQQALALEQTDEAAGLAALDALVVAFPDWVLARLEDARLRLKRGQGLELAEAHLEAARSYHPENARGHFLWGMLMEERRDARAAIASYEIALTLRPDYDEARFRIAGLQLAQGDFKAAADSYRLYVRSHPEAVGARLQLALAAERAGALKEAEQELKRLFEAPASRKVAGRKLAEFYERTGHAGQAARVRAAIEPPARKLRELQRSGR